MFANSSMMPTRPRPEFVNNETFLFEPPVIENITRATSSIGLLLGSFYSVIPNAAEMSNIIEQLTPAPHERDAKQFRLKHVIGSAFVGYSLAKATGIKEELKLVIELVTKTTLAIGSIDHFIDENLSYSLDLKINAIESLRNALCKGVVDKLGGQREVALRYAAEVYEKLHDSPRFAIFQREANSLADCAIKHLKFGQRTFADTIKIGSHSLGLLVAIPITLNLSVAKRHLKAAKHFGAMLEIADDIQDRKEDHKKGCETFATELDRMGYQSPLLHPIVRRAIIYHAKKCFECLDTEERDVYRYLWRVLGFQWDLFTFFKSNKINPSISDRALPTIDKPDQFRATTKHGQYWGPFFYQPRIGKNGEIILVHKLRTMTSYGRDENEVEFDLMLNKPKLQARVTNIGRFLRTYFLDEIPQVVNFIKGELKLIGLRPLSPQAFDLLSKEVKERYLRYGPACIGILYGFSTIPETEDLTIHKQRESYICNFYDDYDKKPIRTTLYYLSKVIAGILLHGKRGI